MTKTTNRLEEIDQQTQQLAQSIKNSIAELAAQIVPLNDRYRRITGEDFMKLDLPAAATVAMPRRRGRPPTKHLQDAASHAAPAAAGKKKRIRRTTEQLKTQAEAILAFVKKAGADGVTGAAVRKEFGNILPSIKVFVKEYAGKTLKSKGEKAGMTYHHSD